MSKLHSIDDKSRLFVLNEGRGFSCLGFDVCEERITRYAAEIGIPRPVTSPGTAEAFKAYEAVCEQAHAYHLKTGKRIEADLTPQLIGLEGRRVEVLDKYGERRRFNVGKSGGWIPVHLEIHNRRSTGGAAVVGAPFESVRVIR